MHIGLEAEGRFKGLPTLMMTPEEFIAGQQYLVEQPFFNIYITDTDNVLDLDIINDNRDPYTDPILSIERTKIDKLYENLDIIYQVPEIPVWFLKSTDQIRMNDGRDVWMIPVDCMIRTTPDDYKGDFDV